MKGKEISPSILTIPCVQVNNQPPALFAVERYGAGLSTCEQKLESNRVYMKGEEHSMYSVAKCV